jgi:hypothetical protein
MSHGLMITDLGILAISEISTFFLIYVKQLKLKHTGMTTKLVFIFFVGFSIGCFVILSPFIFTGSSRRWQIAINSQQTSSMTQRNLQSGELFDDSLAQKLFNEVKILCMVITYPPNHMKKGIHVQNTWGKRCNKLIFITSKEDDALEDSLVLNITESREVLWNKTRLAFLNAHDNYIDDFDFFLKADDDKYVDFNLIKHFNFKPN